jgi:hypothetical protein
LKAVIYYAGPTSALQRSARGFDWTDSDVMLADVVDLLAEANWQRARLRRSEHPKPVKRPWVTDDSQNIGKDPIPISDFYDWWNSTP